MLQLTMIKRVHDLCSRDEGIVGALMFGSFAIDEGDAFSDIEFAIFIQDERFDTFPQHTWLQQIHPVAAYFIDDFGHHTALFENGVRGEFHFMRASEMSVVESWKGYAWFPSLDAAVVLDRSGELSRYASVLVGGPPERGGAAEVERLMLNLTNLMLFGANVLNRGEFARAWALLSRAHEYLLKLIRLSEGTTAHWPTPSRALESDLSPATYERYVTCTAGAQPDELFSAYRASWTWFKELAQEPKKTLNITIPPSIAQKVDELLSQAYSSPSGAASGG
ncbi:Lnu(F)/Lnu(G) family lincosamide nucleotidyltransferase [Lujinxingia sediminis]|uniref:Lnu(F)/Lnu(G) family lincosamide nucleotidyltransferase n=1 Tax=Lujinxingia sediminis TaxID=2480984 RepID=A0ABY0CYL5_9DELT|nr:Lnu(F)/Lnu(G) family lincosamide nucleotidyltransferase [Lujinxingia sediminis]RVU48525.1 Lnu(F)/Lnu(G) family lincosamide nucleotidyltransferase [Lujinxingia sediminis]